MDALAHGALESRIGPCADSGLDIRRDVGRVNDAERRLERAPAGIGDAARYRYGRPRSRRAPQAAGRVQWSRRTMSRYPAARLAQSLATAVPPRPCRHRYAYRGDLASALRRLKNGFCLWRSFRRPGLVQQHRCLTLLAAQSRQNPLRRERRFAEPHTGRIEDRVGDRRSTRHRSGFADTERRLILTRQHQHVDLGNIRKFDDRVSAPFPAVTEVRSNETSSISARLVDWITLPWI